ncbi:MAG: class E sortase [Nitriliruptorales bacterium]
MREQRPEGRDGFGFGMPDPVQHQRTSASGFLIDALRFRRAGRRVLSALITVLLVAGAGMFTYPFFTDLYTNEVVQERLAADFERQVVDAGDVESFADWAATVETGRALTRFVMPQLGVDTLVVEGTSPAALRAGAGHYPNTPLPGEGGNVAIAGHRTTYGKPFNRVDELAEGDRIWLLTPVGEYEYAVSRAPEGWSDNPYITTPRDWQVIEPTDEPVLTLTTCHPKGSARERLIVRAQLVSSHPPGTYASA